MSSRQGRSGLAMMRRLGAVLGIEDVKQAPARLKTDELVPTVGVDPGWADYGQVQLIGQTAVAGTGRWTWIGIGADITNSSAGVPPTSIFPNNGGLEIAILGMSVEVAYSGVGLPNKNVLRIREMRKAAGAAASVITASRFHHFAIVEGETNYFWSYPMMGSGRSDGGDPQEMLYPPAYMAASPIWVPAGSWYGLEVDSLAPAGDVLSAWPANTFINLNIMFTTCPRGFRPPGL